MQDPCTVALTQGPAPTHKGSGWALGQHRFESNREDRVETQRPSQIKRANETQTQTQPNQNCCNLERKWLEMMMMMGKSL